MLISPRLQRTQADVVPVPVAPTVANDTATTKRNTAVVINVLANDADYDAATVQIVANADPLHGVAVANGDGTVTFTPATDYLGEATFTYRVQSVDDIWSPAAIVGVTVTAPAAPVVANHSVYVPHDTAVDVYVLTGATDADNDIVATTASLVTTSPAHGGIVEAGSGLAGLKVTYTPTTGYTGPDSFTYTIADGEGNVSNTGTVYLQVAAAVAPGDDDAWVKDISPWSQFTVRLGVRNVNGSTRNWLTDYCDETTTQLYVLPPVGDEVLPVGCVDGTVDDNNPGTAVPITEGFTFSNVRDVLRRVIHSSQFDLGGVTVIFPAGKFRGYKDGGKPDITAGIRVKIRLLGTTPGDRHVFHTTGANNTWMSWSNFTGLAYHPAAGSMIRFENIGFQGKEGATEYDGSRRAFSISCDQANCWQFVHFVFRQWGEAFHANQEFESIEKGTTSWAHTEKGYQIGVYDRSNTAFGGRQVGIWLSNGVFLQNGSSGDVWHQLYMFGAQLRFDKCALFDTITHHPTRNATVGRHQLKAYAPVFMRRCLIATRLGTDIQYDDMDKATATAHEAGWGQNMDLGVNNGWSIFKDCQFLWRERQELDGTKRPLGGTYVFIGAGARQRGSGLGVTQPYPVAKPSHLDQYLSDQIYDWGTWQDTLNPTRVPGPPQPNGDKFYGLCFLIFKGEVQSGATRLAPTYDWQYPKSDKVIPGPTSSDNYPIPPTTPDGVMIGYTIQRTTAPFDYDFREELATFDGSGYVLNAGGGPPAGWKIPAQSWCGVWPASRANNPRRRMLNPVMYDKNDPDYYWPKVRDGVFNPATPANKDWLRYRNNKLLIDCRMHYVGTGAGPWWIETFSCYPYNGALNDYGMMRMPLPPQWDGVGPQPAGAGVYSGKPYQVMTGNFFGGTMPTGGDGHLGSDYHEPQYVMALNVAYSTQAGIGASTLPTQPADGIYHVDYKLVDYIGGRNGIQNPSLPAIPTLRFNNAGALVAIGAADAWPDQRQTKLSADALVGATTITVDDATGMEVGWRVWVILTNDPWSLTPFYQVFADQKGTAKVDAWAYRTTITNIAGNVLTLDDPIPSEAAYLQPAVGAWAGSTVFAQREFALPAGLPERLEDHPAAKLVWRATDID